MFFRRIRLEKILSFRDVDLDNLPSLNVLIGPNASGKSNLIRVISLLRSLPKDLGGAIAEGGGIREWTNKKAGGIATIAISAQDREYEISLREIGGSFEIPHERLQGSFTRGGTRVTPYNTPPDLGGPTIPPSSSVLSVVRPLTDPTIWKFVESLEKIRLYREFHTGPGSGARYGIAASVLGDSLSEDGANLARVLDQMTTRRTLRSLSGYLSRLFEPLEEVFVSSPGGISQTHVREKGVSSSFSAISLSDGTLRLLCLLAILLNDEPPPVTCIEEPETGLHPDAIRMIADLLIEASERTQLFVTTHSSALVDALSDQPEAVLVCERDFDGFTQFRRLKSADLDAWLERYSLGELWQKGEIGGNRW